jgi:hypothetical protein
LLCYLTELKNVLNGLAAISYFYTVGFIFVSAAKGFGEEGFGGATMLDLLITIFFLEILSCFCLEFDI